MKLREQGLSRVAHLALVGVGMGVLVGTHLHTLGVGVELQLEDVPVEMSANRLMQLSDMLCN